MVGDTKQQQVGSTYDVGSCCGARAHGLSAICVVQDVNKWGRPAQECVPCRQLIAQERFVLCVLCRRLGVSGLLAVQQGWSQRCVMSSCGGQGKGLCSVCTSVTPTRLGRSWFQCRDGGTVPYIDGTGGQQTKEQATDRPVQRCIAYTRRMLVRTFEPAQLRPRNSGQQLWAGGGWWWFTYTCCPLATISGAWLFMGHRL